MKTVLNKLFSPAFDVPKYKKTLIGFSPEFCHNLVRLVMRPNSISSSHWMREVYPWFRTAMATRLLVAKMPKQYIFAHFLTNNSDPNSWDVDQIEGTYEDVTDEDMYGEIENSDFRYVISKIRELSKSFDYEKKYDPRESRIVLYSWYNSIIGVKKKLNLN
jgi:hypothetical protein